MVDDLLDSAGVYRAAHGTRRVYFGMSVSPGYLEAAVMMATARDLVGEALGNMSQMTVSELHVRNTTPSPQQRMH